jgi:hypothetical protein
LNKKTAKKRRKLMASEERYLWMFEFGYHGEERLWWAYFKDEQEVREFLTRLMDALPCVQMKQFEEYERGLMLYPNDFYAHQASAQERTDAKRKAGTRKRDERLFPLAPISCEYLDSFIAGLGDAQPCEVCAGLPILSREGWG